jgi:hypothetical protein
MALNYKLTTCYINALQAVLAVAWDVLFYARVISRFNDLMVKQGLI